MKILKMPQKLPKIKKDSANILAMLKESAIFADISDDILQIFVDNSSVKLHPKGETLFLNEEKADVFYIIANGWVKLLRETIDGDEAVINVLNNGYSFGETAIFEQYIHTFSAAVVEDAELIEIPLALLQDNLEKNAKLAMNMMSLMSRRNQHKNNEIEHRSLQNASQRIGCFLLNLCHPNSDEKLILHLPYGKTIIASRLGMKAETFSRALDKLRKETNIRVNGSIVEIDSIQKLSDYTCVTCSSSYPCMD